MLKRLTGILLAAVLLFTSTGCTPSEKDEEKMVAELQQKMSQSFQTTAKVRYKELETVMTIYKKPMNCAEIVFLSPESLKDMKMTFFTDRVTVKYKEMAFDFVPGSIPGQAASKLVLSALNTAMNDKGLSARQENGQLIIDGKMEEGSFSLTVDAESGNILKLSIPDSELEMELLNFKILE